jgi:hypothetical protein
MAPQAGIGRLKLHAGLLADQLDPYAKENSNSQARRGAKRIIPALRQRLGVAISLKGQFGCRLLFDTRKSIQNFAPSKQKFAL